MSEEFPYYTPAEFLRMRTILEETRKERDAARAEVERLRVYKASCCSDNEEQAARVRDVLRHIAEQDDRTIAESDSGAYLRDMARAALENTKETK